LLAVFWKFGRLSDMTPWIIRPGGTAPRKVRICGHIHHPASTVSMPKKVHPENIHRANGSTFVMER
jgi:hypothetical protein